MRVLIAPDKFAGTLTSHEAATAIAEGWQSIRPDDELVLMPMADGGEGTIETLSRSLSDTSLKDFVVRDQRTAGEPHTVQSLRLPDGRLILEAAQTCGIRDLEPSERNPYLLSSRGLGDLIAATPTEVPLIITLGGTSTIDGGAGLLQRLGHELLDRTGAAIGPGLDGLSQLEQVNVRQEQVAREIHLACDVFAPLVGPTGAAYAFGLQKGLSESQLPEADGLLGRFAEKSSVATRSGVGSDTPGGGAAGGIGYALMAYEAATVGSGAEFVADLVGLAPAIESADVVITGEGRIDETSRDGKAPWHVTGMARNKRVPVLAVAGSVTASMTSPFDAVVELGPLGLTDPRNRAIGQSANLALQIS